MAGTLDDHIFFGDVVLLESETGAFLSVDLCGNVIWDAPYFGSSTPDAFERCLWRVCDKLSFTDQEAYTQQLDRAGHKDVDLETLKKQAHREKQRNQSQLEHPSGMDCRYGDIAEFQHVDTGKFLSAMHTPAVLSRDCLGLGLNTGDLSVYYHILPKYKVRSVGSSVLANDSILLMSESSADHFIHETVHEIADHFTSSIPEAGPALSATTAAAGAAVTVNRESNLSRSTGASAIRVRVYERPNVKLAKEFLNVSQCVRFFDRERDGFVVARSNMVTDGSSSSSSSLSSSSDSTSAPGDENKTTAEDASSAAIRAVVASAGPRASLSMNLSIDASGKNTGSSNSGSSLLEPAVSVRALQTPNSDPTSAEEFSSDAVWSFEYAAPHKQRIGGIVMWNKDYYRIKHVPTGRFLTVGTEGTSGHGKSKRISQNMRSQGNGALGKEAAEEEKFLPVTLEYASSENDARTRSRQTFFVEAVDSNRPYVPSQDCFVTVCHNSFGSLWYTHVSEQTQGLVMSSVKHSFNAILLVAVEARQSAAVRLVRGLLPVIENYARSIQKEKAPKLAPTPVKTGKTARRASLALAVGMTAASAGGGPAGSSTSASATRDAALKAKLEKINNTLVQFICASAIGMSRVLPSEGGEGLKNATDIAEFQERAESDTLLQSCARTQGLVEVLLKTVAAPTNAGIDLRYEEAQMDSSSRSISRTNSNASMNSTVSLLSGSKKVKKGSATGDWSDEAFRPIALTHRLAWAALNQIAIGNSANALYIASLSTPYKAISASTDDDSSNLVQIASQNAQPVPTEALHIILDQVPFPVGAATLLTTLVDDTRELLAKVVDDKTISLFKKMISEFGPQDRFLKFYEAIVSCRGEPLPSNQTIVLKKLLTEVEQKDSILITLYTIPGIEYPQCRHSSPTASNEPKDRYLGEDFVEAASDVDQQSPMGFLGSSVRRGFPKVFVSWQWSDHWRIKTENLYWSPKALDLRTEAHTASSSGWTRVTNATSKHELHVNELRKQKEHVTIEELCWVLNEEDYYEKVRRRDGRTWTDVEAAMEKDTKLKENHKCHSMIGHYLHAQIELMSEMCMGRNYNVILALEEVFPYVMLVGIISSKNLPYKIRGSFVKLLKHLWVDRYPSEFNCGRQSLPDLVWVYKDLTKELDMTADGAFPHFTLHDKNPLRNREEAIYNINSANKYKLLIGFVNSFIKEFDLLVAEKVHQNMCIQEVMALVSMLASFGFYKNVESMRKLISELLPLLDGRSDVQKHTDDVRNLVIQTSAKDSASTIRRVDRYKTTSENNVVMKVKISILQAVLAILNLRSNFRLKGVLQIFKQWVEERTKDSKAQAPRSSQALRHVHDIFDKENTKVNQLYLDGLSIIPISATLLDLLMYESDDLFEYALFALENTSTPVQLVINASKDVLLLENSHLPVFGDLSVFDCYVTQLKQEYESSEVWGQASKYIPLPAGQSNQSYECAWMILDAMHAFLNIGHGTSSSSSSVALVTTSNTINDDEEVPLSFRQELMYNFDVHSILMVCLKSQWGLEPSEMTPEAFDLNSDVFSAQAKEQGRNSMLQLAKGGFSILRAMVLNNNRLRDKFNVFIDILSTPLSRDLLPVQTYLLLGEISRGTVEHVEKTPEKLFRIFGELLNSTSPYRGDPLNVAVDFFLSQLMPEDQAESGVEVIERNQKFATRYMLTKPYKDADDPTSIFAFIPNKMNTEIVQFHALVVSMLAQCCHKNTSAGNDIGLKALPWQVIKIRVTAIMDALLSYSEFVDGPDSDDEDEGFGDFHQEEDPSTRAAINATSHAHHGGQGEEVIVFEAIQDLVKKFPLLFVEVAKSYVDYINWVYLDTIAVDMSIISDPTFQALVTAMADFLVAFGENINYAAKQEVKVSSSPATAHQGKNMVELKSLLASEVASKELDASILNFFANYSLAYKHAKAVIPDEVEETVFIACGSMYPAHEWITVEVCLNMGDRGSAGEIISMFKSAAASGTEQAADAAAVADMSSRHHAADDDFDGGYTYTNGGGNDEEKVVDTEEKSETSGPSSNNLLLAGGRALAAKANPLALAAAATAAAAALAAAINNDSDDDDDDNVFWYKAGDRVSVRHQYQDFLKDVAKAKSVKHLVEEDEKEILRVMTNVVKLTDPSDAEYRKEFEKGPRIRENIKLAIASSKARRASATNDSKGNTTVMRRLSQGGGSPEKTVSLANLEMVNLDMNSGSDSANNYQPLVTSQSSDVSAEEEEVAEIEIRTNRITFEDIVIRMVSYVNHQLDKSENQRGEMHTTARVLSILLSFVKKGRKSQFTSRQNQLNKLGVSELVYRTLTVLPSGPVYQQALELGTNLLMNGNRVVQAEFIKIMSNGDPDGTFFLHLFNTLMDEKEWVLNTQYTMSRAQAKHAKYKKMTTAAEIKEHKHAEHEAAIKEMNKSMLVLQFGQQLCEGHNLIMQNMFRDQSSINRFSYNVVYAVIHLMEATSMNEEAYRHISEPHRILLVETLSFLIEVCQGPCIENQNLIGSYDTLAACKVLLSMNFRAREADHVLVVKCKVLCLIGAILENVSPLNPIVKGVLVKIDKPILDKVYTELYLLSFRKRRVEEEKKKAEKKAKELITGDVLTDIGNVASKSISTVSSGAALVGHLLLDIDKEEEEEEEEDSDPLSIDSKSVSKAICSLLTIRKKIGALEKLIEQERTGGTADGEGGGDEERDLPVCHMVYQSRIASVEVCWNGRIEEVMFTIPEEAQYLSKTTKRAFQQSCDLTNSDTRVKELMMNRHDFNDEMEILGEFSPFFQFILKNYFKLKRVLFLLALMINFNLLLTLEHGSSILNDFYSSYATTKLIMVILGAILLIGYFSIARYWCESTSTFTHRRLLREKKERDELREEELAKIAAKEEQEEMENRAAAAAAEEEKEKEAAAANARDGERPSEVGGVGEDSNQGGAGRYRESRYYCCYRGGDVSQEQSGSTIEDKYKKTAHRVVNSGLIPRPKTDHGLTAAEKTYKELQDECVEEFIEFQKEHAQKEAASTAVKTEWNMNAFIPLFGIVALYAVGCVMHYFAVRDKSSWSNRKLFSTYGYFAAIFCGPLLTWNIRRNIIIPENDVEMIICVVLDTLTDSNVVQHLALMGAVVGGLLGYTFLYSVLLIDFVSMSPDAKNTLRSVIQPWSALVNVGIVFLAVLWVFGVFSLVRFNSKDSLLTGEPDGDDDGAGVACDSAWTCLGAVFYGGILNANMEGVLAQQDPGGNTYTRHFFFDLLFGVVVGYLLLNMVTGIIVDTFGSLREDSQEVHRLLTEETFISGVTHDLIDKALVDASGDGGGLSFEKIQDKEQNMWNYIYYVYYIETKADPNDYDGLESFVAECLKAEDYSWFPRKTSLSIQRVLGMDQKKAAAAALAIDATAGGDEAQTTTGDGVGGDKEED